MERGGLDHPHPRVFLLSTTNGAETHSLAASLTTIKLLRDTSIIEENWNVGKQLTAGFNRSAQQYGIGERAKMAGVEISPWYAFYDASGKADMALRTLFLQETIRQGVLIPYIAISASHRQAEVDRTLEAMDAALKVVANAIDKGSVEGLLTGPVVKPVFRKYNSYRKPSNGIPTCSPTPNMGWRTRAAGSRPRIRASKAPGPSSDTSVLTPRQWPSSDPAVFLICQIELST